MPQLVQKEIKDTKGADKIVKTEDRQNYGQ